MVVVSISLLLLFWGIPAFSKWKSKHDVAGQMEMLYSDLQFARMNAYSQKVVSGAWWNNQSPFTSYQVRADATKNNSIDDAGDTQIGSKTVALKYSVTASPNQNSVSFDGRGFINLTVADPANPVNFYVASSNGSPVDCVSVSNTRIALGKWDGANCKAK
jgi:Tfp pilus assembly protein FimT